MTKSTQEERRQVANEAADKAAIGGGQISVILVTKFVEKCISADFTRFKRIFARYFANLAATKPIRQN